METTQELTPEEEKLLLALNNHDITEIGFEVSEEGIVYKGLEDIAKAFNPRVFRHILSSLSAKGYLKETGNRMVLFCPRCGSPEIYSQYSCTRCGSADISRKDFIEHTHCGYIDDKSKFEKDLEYVCPQCGTVLGSIDEEPSTSGKESYTMIGSSFICNRCGNNFERTNILHLCKDCEANFDARKSRYEKISAYEKTRKALELSPSHTVREIKNTIRERMRERGLTVELDGTVRGQSQGEHPFDIIGRNRARLVIGDVSLDGSSTDIIALFGKKVDVQSNTNLPIKAFMVDFTGEGNGSGLGTVYDIKLLKVGEGFEEELDEYLEIAMTDEEDTEK